jgi:arylsulfatase A-like enzyme
MFQRRFYWLIILLGVMKIALGEQPPKLPSFLICITESHAAQLLGPLNQYGSELDPTPFLSKIAQQGFRHFSAYCTNGNALPSAYRLQTGKIQNSSLELNAENNFLGKYFKKLGYNTAIFGKWDWGDSPNKLGFSSWGTIEDKNIFYNPKVNTRRGTIILEGHTTDIITDLAIQWLDKQRDEQKPFFLLLVYQATQRPWIPPIRMIEKFNDEWFQVPETFFSDFSSRTPSNKYQDMNIAQDLDGVDDLFLEDWSEQNESEPKDSILAENLERMNDEQSSAWKLSWKPQNEAFAREPYNSESFAVWKFQRFFKNYLRCIFTVDENIARIFEIVNTEPNHSTHFIYTAERGRFCGEFGWFGSQWMYEPSTKIPLIFATVNAESKTSLDPEEIFLDTDLYALIKGLSTSSNPKDLNYSKNKEEKSFFFTQHTYPQPYRVTPHIGLRQGRYKIVHYYPFNEWEFYDLESDPLEKENLSNNKSKQDLFATYRKKLISKVSSKELERYYEMFSEDWRREQRSPNKKTR